MSNKSLCAVLAKPGQVEISHFDLPRIGPDEGILKVEMAGVCGTDVKFYHGQTRPHLLPMILGHEILGHIESIGEAASKRYGVETGDRVVVEGSIRCDSCYYCATGNYQFCEKRRSYGTSVSCKTPPHLWGAYSQYMYLAPGSMVHKISESVPAEAGVLTCSVLSNGIQWVQSAGNCKAANAIVIQGVGQQGLAATVAAKEAGAHPIIVTGKKIDKQRFDLAKLFGADYTIDVDEEEPAERVQQITGGRMADIVLEVTATTESMDAAVDMVSKLGTIVFASIVGLDKMVTFPSDKLIFKQARVQFVYTSTIGSVLKAIDIIESGKYPLEKMVTHLFKLEEAEKAIKTVGAEIPGVYPAKVALKI